MIWLDSVRPVGLTEDWLDVLVLVRLDLELC